MAKSRPAVQVGSDSTLLAPPKGGRYPLDPMDPLTPQALLPAARVCSNCRTLLRPGGGIGAPIILLGIALTVISAFLVNSNSGTAIADLAEIFGFLSPMVALETTGRGN